MINSMVNRPGKRIHKLTRIGKNVVLISLLLVMAMLVLAMVQSKLTGKPPTVAGHQIYIVVGGSMSPTFHAGSLAILRPMAPESIVMGDIITYRITPAGDTLTTHRVVGVHREGQQLSFTTRGDANTVNDAYPVRPENVLGKIVFTVPYAGYLMNFGRTQTGLLVLVIIPGVLIIFFEVRNLWRYAVKHGQARDQVEDVEATKRL